MANVLAAYDKWEYRGGIGENDIVWIAEKGTELIGAVRIAHEESTLVLRGMRVAEPWRRKKVGSQMLNAIAKWLGNRTCYCIPYIHLVGFYGYIEFIEVALESAPPFLVDRVIEYRGRGLNVTLMRR